jgi:autotransporter-associated beta strand protein
MNRPRIITAIAAAMCLTMASGANAQLDDKTWVGGTGSQLWQVDANWLLNGMPTTFPNDPGRVDPSEPMISNVIGANLSVNLGSNLTVDVGATDVTVAALTIGGTSSAVTTNISSSGGRLVFEHNEINDDSTTPGTLICSFNCGNPLITSQGVAGSTNTISAVLGAFDEVEVAGTRNLTVSGGVSEMRSGAALSAVTPGLTVFITGGISTVDQTMMPDEEDVGLTLNGADNSQGIIDVSSVISGPGRMRYGAQSGGVTLPFGQTILRGNNTYTGRSIIARGNLVLDHNNALGTGDMKQEGDSGGSIQTGYNFLSTDDNRTIANNVIIAQWQTFKGEHSITMSGRAYQTNNRGYINMLPAGKTVTFTGQQYVFEFEDHDAERELTFDGSGKTIVTGGIRNLWDSENDIETTAPDYEGHLRKRGSGTLVVDGDNLLPNSDASFNGSIMVLGGNLHFATDADWQTAARFQTIAGAVGVDAGVVNNATLFAKLNNNNPATNEPDSVGFPVGYDQGGLMLGNGEYGMNLDFGGAHANARDMTLAAHEGGSTYTGTITVGADNTYKLGGGSGTLTMPNANQLTGARNLLVTNGGEANVTGTNNYTGTTSVMGEYVVSLERAAIEDRIAYVDNDLVPNDQTYLRTTLTATTLANGGSPSSIGSSTNAASNVYIQGSTLKYVGGATSSDRLFTIGTAGATIDASGSGALSLTNTSALGVDTAENRNAWLLAIDQENGRTRIRGMTKTEDLHPGMTISSPNLATGIPAGTTITRISSPTEIQISQPIGNVFEETALAFGPAPERKLTLTGSNSGDNTLASLIGNASDGGLVGLTKSGAGKWIVTANNTYGGTTTVDAGTLLVNGNHTGAGLTTVNVGGTLGGTGTLAGGIMNNGTINAGASVGTLNVTGNVTMAADSHFLIELSGSTADRLAITGNLDLSALNNFLDVTGSGTGPWTIATYTGMLTGTFENVTSGYMVNYGSGTNSSVTLSFQPPGLLGDFNEDDKVDAADYVVWRKNGTGPLPNDNGLTTSADRFNLWRANFGNMAPGSGGGSGAEGTVPEPTSAALLLVGLALGCWARRRT